MTTILGRGLLDWPCAGKLRESKQTMAKITVHVHFINAPSAFGALSCKWPVQGLLPARGILQGEEEVRLRSGQRIPAEIPQLLTQTLRRLSRDEAYAPG